MAVFFNLSNHSKNFWSEQQMIAVPAECDKVVDVKFPNVDPKASATDIKHQAVNTIKDLVGMGLTDKDTVLCQGEMTLVFALVRELKLMGVRVVAATTERKSIEKTNPDGSVTKTTIFEFVQFREY